MTPSPLQGHLYRLSLLSDGPAWNVNAACQNMAAILNDPKKGKQKDFFTRTWGDGFIENTAIPESSLLPIVDEAYFTPYLKKISKRYKKSSKKSSMTSAIENIPTSSIPKPLGNPITFVFSLFSDKIVIMIEIVNILLFVFCKQMGMRVTLVLFLKHFCSLLLTSVNQIRSSKYSRLFESRDCPMFWGPEKPSRRN